MERPFLTLNKDCHEAVLWLRQRLSHSGLAVVQTFDLRDANDHLLTYSCPRHVRQKCDCQMVILLVYENGFPPVSIILHGHDGQTWLTMVDVPQRLTNFVLNPSAQNTLGQIISSLRNEDPTDIPWNSPCVTEVRKE